MRSGQFGGGGLNRGFKTSAEEAPRTDPVPLATVFPPSQSYSEVILSTDPPQSVAVTNAAGSSNEVSAADHEHALIVPDIASKTANYTLDDTNFLVLADASGGAFTLTLPAASGIDGRIYWFIKTDSGTNAVTVDGNASETINGATTQALSVQWDVLGIVSDGTNWKILAQVLRATGYAVASKTANYTATATDFFIALDASGGAFTITLPAAASHTGRIYWFKKTDSSANAITVDGNSSETIDGALTQALSAQHDYLGIICDGSNWRILAQTPAASTAGIFDVDGWWADNPAAGASNVQMTRSSPAGVGGQNLWIAPKAGSIRGLAIWGSADITAGTFTVRVKKNGSSTGMPSDLAATNGDHPFFKASGPHAAGTYTFAAGDDLQIEYDTSGGYSATTIDVRVSLQLSFT